jgi:SpoU rRNA methylase family enzyme
LRVSGSIALSGVAEKMKAHWKPGSQAFRGFLCELDGVLSDLCGQKLLTAEGAEKSHRSRRTNLVTRFGYSGPGLRVSGSIALSGVAEKMKAHWKPGSRITKRET